MSRSRAIAASYAGVLAFAGLVFLGAGKLVYWQGLLYVGLALAGTTLSHLLVPAGSRLTEQRARDATAGEPWDRRLLGLMFLANLATFATAGADSGRFGWSGPVPLGVNLAGAALMGVGQGLFAVAKRENASFSSTVRIHGDAPHGHPVCDTGPYRFVRHPGYLGLLLGQLAFPWVMGSFVALLPAAAAAGLLVVRTAMEDRFLMRALPGYPDYARRTRWRLVPGLF